MTETRPGSGLRARALGALICALGCHLAVAADLPQMRSVYLRALDSLDSGQIDAFEAAKAELVDYPLYPYLDFQQHRRRLSTLSAQDVAAFRERWADVPVATRLYDEWMDDLARRGAWDVFLQNFTRPANAQRECDYLRALDRSGKHDEAMQAVEPLWLIGTSQPKNCDALFAVWIERGHVNNRLVWDRLTLALQARSWDLARYLAGLLSREMQKQGDLFYRVARDSTLIGDTTRFKSDDAATRDIVAFGVRRLATSDPQAADTAWASYRTTLSFVPDVARSVTQDVTIGFARRGIVIADADLAPTPDGRHQLVIEALIIAAITNKDWSAVVGLLGKLDEAERGKARWQYWLGRAQRGNTGATAATVPVPDPWEMLANERQYYGFLAAQALSKPLALNDRPGQPDAAVMDAMRERPAMARIVELYAIGDRANARREWVMLQPNLDGAQRAGAAYLIADLGWVDQSILAANATDNLRDDLSMRFPSPFTPLFINASRSSAVPISFLFGIARQESVFRADVRSSAGALGVMQLMPATAAATARNAGDAIPVSAALFDPVVNIRLGSRHLAELLERFGGNRVLVAAAYNAGAHRVDRWVRDRPARPADIWIETIPFAETRDYVKNVMAFTYIYGQRLGHPTPFLGAHER